MAVTKRVRKKNGKRSVFYEAEVYIRGTCLARRCFINGTDARVWHNQEKGRFLSGQQIKISENMLFEDCFKHYLEESFPRLRKSSQQSMEARFPYFEEGPLLRVKMSEFSDRTIDHWMTWLLKHETAKNPGRRSFTHELKLLSVILNWYRNAYDATFIVPVVKRHRERCVYKRNAARRPDYFARPEEVRDWIDWLREHRKPVYFQLAMFMMLTGARVGEACGLTWENVDSERRMARVIKTVRWDHWTREPFLEDCTKTDESVRLLMLPEILIEMLEQMRTESTGEGPVFRSLRGDLMRYNAIQSAFNQGFAACKLPWKSTHICRHTFGTLALMATKNLSAVQASLGHRSRKVTERYAKAVAMLSNETGEETAKLIDFNQTQPNSLKSRIKSRIE